MNLDAWLSLLEQRHPQAIELGLGRCGAVYQRLGSPRPAARVFTVAGTNGKGSTVAYLEAMSSSLGQQCGAFTSPHIFHFNERIRILGEPVDDDCLVRAFEQVEVARGEISLTYFEFTTLAGLLVLNLADLDCAVLEVGLGGRLDAVNLVDADCALITPIGLDHQEFLGPDLESISAEKAGIIRPGAPVVCTESDPPMPIIRTAADLQAPLFHRGRHFDLVQAPGSDSTHLQFSLGDQAMLISAPAMRGNHQCDNLAAALAAFVLLNPGCMAKAAEISDAIVNCSLPGRIQQVSSSPDIFLDVGHNELAAEALSGFLGESGRFNTTCVLAMLADKPVEAVALVMKPFCQRWFCAESPGARGQSGERLAQRLKTVLPKADVDIYGPPGEAMEAALSSWETDQTILVFGSFSTVSAVADWLTNRRKQDGHDADRIIAGKSEIVPEKN